MSCFPTSSKKWGEPGRLAMPSLKLRASKPSAATPLPSRISNLLLRFQEIDRRDSAPLSSAARAAAYVCENFHR